MDFQKRVLVIGLAAAAVAVAVGSIILTSRSHGAAAAARPPSPELRAMLDGLSAAAAPTAGKPAPSGPAAKEPNGPPAPARRSIRCYVLGAVRRPGVYSLPDDARVQEALSAAGGPSPHADLAAINLADFLKDGEQVVFPEQTRRGSAAAPPTSIAKRAAGPMLGRYPTALVPVVRSTTAPAPQAAAAPGEPVSPANGGATVNLNTATAAELDTLPGVGPATAAAIIQHRKDHGPFARIEDIQDVRGIGEKKFAAMRDRITVR